jgi:diguanylate cyclase (GGDEF)-like protein/PAS domain S-box-containing protein
MMGSSSDVAGLAFRPAAIPTLATALAALMLGAAVVRRERFSRVSLLFLLILLTIAVWLCCFSLMYCALELGVALAWARAAYLGIPFIPAAIYSFTVAATGAQRRRRAVTVAVWALSALGSAVFVGSDAFLEGLHRYPWGYYPRFTRLGLVYVAFFVAVLALSLYEHWMDSRAAETERQRNRSRSYLLAFFIGSLGSVDYLPAYGVPVYPVGFLPVLVFIALTARAVRRHRLVDITPSLAAPQILATMADPLVVCDAEDDVRLVNPAACRLLGYEERQLLGMPVASLVEGSGVRAALRGRPSRLEEAGLRASDGTRVDVSLSIAPVEEEGVHVGAVLIARDVRERRAAEVALRHSEARFRALAEGEAAAVFVVEGEGLRYVNPALEALTGHKAAELLSMKFWDLAHPDARPAFREQGLLAQSPSSPPARFELKLLNRRGEPRWVDLTLTPVEIEGRRSAMATAFDITERKLTDEALRESERRLREILDNMQLVAVLLDLEGVVTYCNEYLLELLGCVEDEVVGRDWFASFLPEEGRDAARRSFREKVTRGTIEAHEQGELVTRAGDRRLISWSNTILRDAEGRVLGAASIGADVTDKSRAEERLRHGAFHDALTGLPNRALFMDRLATCLARFKRRPQYRFAALFLDIDRFKGINDSFGHLTGDKLLVEIGRRLESCLRPGDSVARLGGDEFAVLVDDMADEAVPNRVADRIQETLSAPFELAGREVFLTASIGIAPHKARYQGPEDFLRDADTAMHHAKTRGRARHQVFDTTMHKRAVGLLQIENDLHRAVEREELSVHYQPIVSLRTGGIAGFEALVRWQRPGHGFVPPADFIRIAEETGLIIPMGTWVLRQACRQVRAWQEQTIPAGAPLVMSVNLSARQFVQADLVAQVGAIVEETEIEPGSLKLEVTESVLMQDPEAAAGMLAELARRRVRVCIDDFGTGYSSLSYLLRFPASTLKIDRSFVTDMSAGSQHSEMVRTIVVLAHNLGMDVIAEGVENGEQVRHLQALGADYMQGYLLSKPVDAATAEELLKGAPLPLGPSR